MEEAEEIPTQVKQHLPQNDLGSFDRQVLFSSWALAPEHCHILPVVLEHGIGLLTTLHSTALLQFLRREFMVLHYTLTFPSYLFDPWVHFKLSHFCILF